MSSTAATTTTTDTSEVSIFVTLMLTFFTGILVIYVVVARRTLLETVVQFFRARREEKERQQQQRELELQERVDMDAAWRSEVEEEGRGFTKAIEAQELAAADRGKEKRPQATKDEFLELLKTLNANDRAEEDGGGWCSQP